MMGEVGETGESGPRREAEMGVVRLTLTLEAGEWDGDKDGEELESSPPSEMDSSLL
jgi:hypothetical protein